MYFHKIILTKEIFPQLFIPHFTLSRVVFGSIRFNDLMMLHAVEITQMDALTPIVQC